MFSTEILPSTSNELFHNHEVFSVVREAPFIETGIAFLVLFFCDEGVVGDDPDQVASIADRNVNVLQIAIRNVKGLGLRR
jgi:hypothetical protein